MAKGTQTDTAEPATDEVAEETQSPVPPPPSDEEIEAQIAVALKDRDFKLVQKLSGQLSKGQVSKEKQELETKQAALKEVTESIKEELKALFDAKRKSGELDKADHIKFFYDFKDNIECGLFKSHQARARSGVGTGSGKKHTIKSEELFKLYGHVAYKDSGMTHQEAHDSNTDGNYRFQVRVSMLKLNGDIPS